MPFAACLGACPTREEAVCQTEDFDQFLTTETCLLVQRGKEWGKRRQKGWEGRQYYAGFLGLPGLPTASEVGCPSLPPLTSHWPWLGCAHHEVPQGRRVDQSKLPNASLFYAGFVVPCTAINLHASHCPF